MLLDTGSAGVRVLAGALGSALAGRLPAQTGATDDPAGNAPIAQCATFGSGYTWGSIKRADVTIGGEIAGNLPVQVIGDGAFATPPDCLSHGGPSLNTLGTLGAKGVIGIAPGIRDFPLAAQTVLSANYYYCPSSGSCTNTRVPLNTQVMNPVAGFAADNNGTIISLPAIRAGGQTSATGQLTFGIGTQQNNALPSTANIVSLDQNGYFTSVYRSRSLTSIIDSGTNVYSFPDNTIPTAVLWTDTWYTPPAPLSLSASMQASNGSGIPTTVPFSLGNAVNLLASGNAAYDSLGAPMSGAFIWGLPFFYGRNVYTVLDNAKVGPRTGPLVAF
jgi:hypothetical protein